jgi:hypothetical protein
LNCVNGSYGPRCCYGYTLIQGYTLLEHSRLHHHAQVHLAFCRRLMQSDCCVCLQGYRKPFSLGEWFKHMFPFGSWKPQIQTRAGGSGSPSLVAQHQPARDQRQVQVGTTRCSYTPRDFLLASVGVSRVSFVNV